MSHSRLTDALPVEEGLRVNAACDGFEAAWREGDSPQIDDFLQGWEGDARAALLEELVHLDAFHRGKRGEECRAEDYRERFPELSGEWLAGLFPDASANQTVQTPRVSDLPLTIPSAPSNIRLPGTRTVGGYELLKELGRGGMGVVYKARQVSVNRVVALKMILSGEQASAAELARFRGEAEAVAQLEHPNIVQIHEVGEHEEHPYFSMEFVEGGGLDRRIAGNPQPPLEAAALVEAVARAMHYAHERGIVHRDLKPANILLAGKAGGSGDGSSPPGPAPKVSDFGLAKRLDASGPTRSGAAMGTPSYMAPEQVSEAKSVGPPADVYSLGAILYELLTGRPPFKAATPMETLLQVVESDPVAPSRLTPRIPRDLETICLKCLQKEAHKRYASAAALADDLRRFRAGEPITARPVGAVERGVKWARRRPTVASLIGAVAAVTVLGFALVIWQWREAVAERKLADDARNDATREAAAAENARGAAAGKAVEAEKARGVASEKAREANAARVEADLALEESRTSLHLYSLNLARTFLVKDPGGVRGALYLCPPSRRGFEWHYLRNQSDTSLSSFPGQLRRAVTSAAYGPRFFAAGVRTGGIQVWDAGGNQVMSVEGGQVRGSRVVAMAFNDGQLVAITADGRVRRWEVAGGRALDPFTPEKEIVAASFGPSAKLLACVGESKTVGVWDVATGKSVLTLPRTAEVILCLAFSPDGNRIATGGGIGQNGKSVAAVRIWDAATGEEVKKLDWQGDSLPAEVAFGAGGDVAAVGVDGKVRLWNPSGTPLGELDAPEFGLNAAFSPDGKWLAVTTRDCTVKVFDTGTRRPLSTHRGHVVSVNAVAFRPDGQRIVSGDADGMTKVWDAGASREHTTVAIPGPDPNPCSGVAFSADGKRVATAGADGKIHVVEADTGRRGPVLVRHSATVSALAFSADGSRLASADEAGCVKVWDLATGAELVVLQKEATQGIYKWLAALAFSPDGRRLTWVGSDGTVRVWEWEGRRLVQNFRGKQPHETPGATELNKLDAVTAVAVTRDASRVAVGGTDHAVQVWDPASAKRLSVLPTGASLASAAAFNDDGSRLACACSGATYPSTVLVWNLGDGRELAAFEVPYRVIGRLSFGSSGGRHERLALSEADGSNVFLWVPGQELLRLDGPGAVTALAFAPGGGRIVAAGSGGLRVWNAEPSREVFHFQQRDYPIYAVVFHPDGRLITSGGYELHVRQWAYSRLLLSLPLEGRLEATGPDPNYCWDVAISPDGKRLAGARGNTTAGSVRVWDAGTGRALHTFGGRKAMAKAVVFAPDGRLYSAGWDGEVRVADLATGREEVVVSVHPKLINGLALSPDGALITIATRDGGVVVWSEVEKRVVHTIKAHSFRTTRVAFSPDGKRLASAGGSGETGEVKVWDVASARLLRTLPHRQLVYGVAFSPRGDRIATGGDDYVLRVWDANSDKEPLALSGHVDSINRVAFSPDGQFVASGGEDKTVRVWLVAPELPPR